MPSLKWFQRNLVVKPSLIKGGGLGVFARCEIPKGTCLGWYRGRYLSRKEWIESKNDKYTWYIDKDFYVDAFSVKNNNVLRYVNGAKTPPQYLSINVKSYEKNKKIWYKTIKKISGGCELIVNYGPDYWDPVLIE